MNARVMGDPKFLREIRNAKGCLFSKRDEEFPRKIRVSVPEFLGKMARGAKCSGIPFSL